MGTTGAQPATPSRSRAATIALDGISTKQDARSLLTPAFARAAVEEMPQDEANWRKVREDLASMFDQARGQANVLNEKAFAKAIVMACPRLTRGQVNAMWTGYCKGTGRDSWMLEDFCACAEAVEDGDLAAAAEFADMDCESFALLGSSGRGSIDNGNFIIKQGGITRQISPSQSQALGSALRRRSELRRSLTTPVALPADGGLILPSSGGAPYEAATK